MQIPHSSHFTENLKTYKLMQNLAHFPQEEQNHFILMFFLVLKSQQFLMCVNGREDREKCCLFKVTSTERSIHILDFKSRNQNLHLMRKPFILEVISLEPVRNYKILFLLQFHIKNTLYAIRVSENTFCLLKMYFRILISRCTCKK